MLKLDAESENNVQHQQHTVDLHTLPNNSDQLTTVGGDSQNTLDVVQTLGRLAKSREDAGILPRELGVSFRGLEVIGLGAASSYQDTVGSIFNPSNMIKQIQAQRHPSTRHIISGFEGTVKPGEMLRQYLPPNQYFKSLTHTNLSPTVVLGRPGSGCSTLLKILTNKHDEFHSTSGDILYNTFLPGQISAHFRGDVHYCPEDDIHFPTLTVGQTVEFAARVRAPRAAARMGESRAQYAKHTADVLLKLFGLEHARNTQVGDATIRGISGGEKKRLSICEAMAARSCLTSWDK
uniref:ABC transporter domain-containing protein n=1 Tax=Psilocybe cubensis TaxID=181762 RepID=A0A8H7XM72_PSICU